MNKVNEGALPQCGPFLREH